MSYINKIIFTSMIASCCLLISACSRGAEFVVINNSDSIIEVEYTLNSNLKSLDNPTTIPLKMNLEDWDGWFVNYRQKAWRETPPEEFSYDSETQVCRLKLAPNQVLRITFVDYDDFQKVENFQQFRVTNLKLSGKYGEMILKGNQMYHQFEKKDSQNYYISYERKGLSERGI